MSIIILIAATDAEKPGYKNYFGPGRQKYAANDYNRLLLNKVLFIIYIKYFLGDRLLWA